MKFFNVVNLPSRFIRGIKEIQNMLDFEINHKGEKIHFMQGNGLSIKEKDDEFHVIYQKDVEVFKALALITKANISSYHKKRTIELLSFMVDCSRNAVRNLKTIKKIIRLLAILGYNELQLYTEDTFKIKNEPYFGAFRGGYSKNELKEIIAYADLFAIEVVPCIQTLAHLNTITIQPHYSEICDCNDILLVDNEKTYLFIENMIKTIRNIFTSHKINLGLDEAHMLGRGSHLDEYGYQDQYSIFIRHLNRVNDIAKKYNFEPMMWSDMFFRICSKGNYYGNGKIDSNVIKDVPKNITLCYWDYDHITEKEYKRMFARHKKFHCPIRFVTATWNWIGLAPNYTRTDNVVKASIQACKNEKIDAYMLTSWGDNGSESSYFTSIPTLFDVSFQIYDDDKEMNVLFKNLFHMSIREFKKTDLLNRSSINQNDVVNPGKYLLYNDYFCGMFDCHTDSTYPSYYENVSKKMHTLSKKCEDTSYYFQTLEQLSKILSLKSRLGVTLRLAYQKNDICALKKCARDIKKIIHLLDTFISSFRNQWFLENKTYGFDVQELRLGGLKERSYSCLQRLNLYINGKIRQIEELEEKSLPYISNRENKDVFINFYNRIVSYNVV